MIQSLTDIHRWMNSENRIVNLEGSRSGDRRRKRYSSGSSDSRGPTRHSISSSHRDRRKRHYKNSSCDEFRKARPPTFNGEIKNEQEAEAWFHGMRKYFQVQEYCGNMKARVSIFNLTGRASIRWEHCRQVKKITERKIVWKWFQKYFKQKYLSVRYYDDKIKEFHELRLG